MANQAELYNKLKEKEKLFPHPGMPGKFIPKQSGHADGIGHMAVNNWVFHDQIREKVLEGKYDEINPVCAEFVPTLNCSNRCYMCGYKCTKMLEGCWIKNRFSDPDVHMPSVAVAKEYLDFLIDGGVKGIIFTGGGEPFLFRGLEKLVAHATRRGVDSVTYTNGNVPSEKRVWKLIEARPLLVRVSLNAIKKYIEFHQPLEPEGALERCLRTIETLARGSLQNPGMDVGVGVMINEINQDDLVNTALALREIVEKTGGGIKFVTYRPEFRYYLCEQLPAELLDKTCDIVETQVRKVLEGTGIRVSNLKRRYRALKEDTRTYAQCRATGFLAEMGPRGRLFFCCDRSLNRKYCIRCAGEYQDLRAAHHGKSRQDILDYVNLSKCDVCPPACKSHEVNLQFQEIENLRARGEMYKVRLWIDEQRKQPAPKMVNFP